jgi:hypothetical protein
MGPNDDEGERTSTTTGGDFVSAEAFSVAELRAAVFEDDGRDERKPDQGREREAGSAAGLDPLVAVSLLARKEYEGMGEDLRRLLFDGTRDGRLRHNAAVSLGRALGEDAEPVLLEALERDDLGPEGRRGVLTALGEVGGEGALDAIAKYREQFPEPVRRQAAWAETLVAFRSRTPGTDERGRLSLPGLVDVEGKTVEVSLREADEEVRKEALEDIRQGFLRLPLKVATEPVFELDCLNQRLLVLFDETFLDSIGTSLERKHVASVVLGRDEVETDGWSPHHYVLVQPDGATADGSEEGKAGREPNRGRGLVFLTSTGGRIRYGGSFAREDGALSFEIRAVERPGLRPTRFEGRFVEGELVLEVGVAAAFEPDARTPSPASRDESSRRE